MLLAEYEATIVAGERFADVARFRLYLEREINLGALQILHRLTQGLCIFCVVACLYRIQ
jgi:hypothetical protein